MRLLALAALLLLGSCGTTPKDVADTGRRSTHTLVNPPATAAGCMARNIENHRSVFSTNVRQIDAERLEIVVRAGPEHVFGVVQVEPAGKGSRATVFQRSEWFYRSDEFVPAMVKGC